MKIILQSIRSLALAALLAATAKAAGRPPNIVLILADDFGVGDIQAHYPANKIPTPHLDRLVSQGMSFTDAHSPSAVCTPTRYGLLTGRYAWRTRLQRSVLGAYEPPLIAAGRTTLPGFLRDHGYRSVGIGKWHLGWEWPGPQPVPMSLTAESSRKLVFDFTRPVRGGPTERGFDYYFGLDVPNYPPFTFIENQDVVTQPTARYRHDPLEGVHMPGRFDGYPMAPDWHFADILPELTRRSVRQIHELAAQDRPFFLFFSMTTPHDPVVPSQAFLGKSGIAPIADFVMETDWSAGQVIQAISDAGIADNTIVIFTADNGHSHYTGWPQLIAAGHQPSGPYRGHKGDIWEGGHREPLVMRWPKQIAAGARSDQLVSLTDLFATCAELIGADLPANGAEDSISFLASALGKPAAERRTTDVNHSGDGEFAYRDGPWKLVFRNSGRNLEESRGKPTIAELYHLDSDIAETRNVAEQHPDIVQRMRAQLEQLIARGATRTGLHAANDTTVRYDLPQTTRWGRVPSSAFRWDEPQIQ